MSSPRPVAPAFPRSGLRTAKEKAEALAADLIVEASGRGNLTLGLLKSIGQPEPEESIIGVDIGYATAVFAIRTIPRLTGQR